MTIIWAEIRVHFPRGNKNIESNKQSPFVWKQYERGEASFVW